MSHGADIISFSTHTDASQAVIDALYNAKINGRNGKGCIIIKSAGNEGSNGITYPGRQPIVLSVGATNQIDLRIYDSSYGPELDVMAPSEIYATDISGSRGDNPGDYQSGFKGTSAAAPQVAGVAGLMLAADNSMTEETVRKIICYTADDINTSGFDNETGWGRINALNAVKSAAKQFTLSGNLSNNQCWWGNVTINGNVYVPSGVQLIIISNTILNLGSFSISSTGGRIIIESGLPVVYLKEGAEIKSIFSSVQTAINNWSSGLTIYLQSGTFSENLSISSKSGISIWGQGAYSTTINGGISISSSNNVNLHSFKLQNSTISVSNSTGQNITGIYAPNCQAFEAYNSSGSFYVDAPNSTYDDCDAYFLYNSWADIEGVSATNHNYGVYLYGGQANIYSTEFCNNQYDVVAANYGVGYVNGGTLSGDPNIKTYGNVTCSGYSICSSLKSAISSTDGEKKDPFEKEYLKLSEKYSALTNKIKAENKGKTNIERVTYKNDYTDLMISAKNFISDYTSSGYVKNALLLLANSCKELGDYEEMKSALESISSNKKLSSISLLAKRHMIDYYANNKDYAKAILTADEVLKSTSDGELICDVLYSRALLNEFFLENKDEAVKDYSLLINTYPKNALVKLAEKRIKHLGEAVKAIKLAEKEEVYTELAIDNYPNPFNPVTKISFTIPERMEVRIKVYDVLGRELANLTDRVYEVGKYEITFDASNLPSGIYFYNLSTPKNSLTKKMMVVK